VLVVFGHDPGSLRSIEAAGRIGFHHDMLEVAGAASVLADVNRVTVQLTTEDILRLAPDAIVDLHYGATEAAGRDAERALWGRLAAVPAVRAGRVHLLTGDEFVVPGPRLAEATERLGRILHPEAFAP
jgi:iron complex transport system substrate-binding protein